MLHRAGNGASKTETPPTPPSGVEGSAFPLNHRPSGSARVGRGTDIDRMLHPEVLN